MPSPLILAIAPTVTVAVLLTVVYLVWVRRRASRTPPPAAPAQASAAPHAGEPRISPFDDGWETGARPASYASLAARAAELARREEYAPPRHDFAFDDLDDEEADPPVPSFLAGNATGTRAAVSQAAPTPAPAPVTQASSGLHCPRCHSRHIDTLDIGRRAGSTLGGAAGATGGVAMALSGAEAGALVGAIGGPVGSIFGGLAGAVIAGLIGSAAGSAAGSAVGSAIDDNLLDNYRCLSCGHTFGSAAH
ncbi:hypothetical protein [Paraburkholderia kururiensis]|uniref:hypothetical protein n=1 Tax=Paraburkholderia kururiensis TaxID=984307 RepID=UPI001F3B3AC8|nr:hypothetical protein [Paraburkholderia kururiensis]